MALIICPIWSRAAHRLMLATVSFARTGAPSWNFSPGRRRNVQVRPSCDTSSASTICRRGVSAFHCSSVLPDLSGDPEQEYFADGIVEEIITALSRFSGLFVIARNSSFIYKGRAVDVKQVGRELGVRYVLEGSVRKAG